MQFRREHDPYEVRQDPLKPFNVDMGAGGLVDEKASAPKLLVCGFLTYVLYVSTAKTS